MAIGRLDTPGRSLEGEEPSMTFPYSTWVPAHLLDIIDVQDISGGTRGKRSTPEPRTAAAPLASSHLSALHPTPRQPRCAIHMMHVRPRSPSADPAPCWPPHQQEPSPAKRRRLHEPARHEPLAPPDLEAPSGPDSDALTSVVFLAAGCAMQLELEGVDLLLEPEPTSVLQVSLPGHTLILVPESLQSSAHLGQPEFSSASPQGAALLDITQDHVVVLQQGSFCEYILDSSYREECDEDADLGFLSPWMDPPADQASGLLSSIIRMPSAWPQGRVPEPYPPMPSSNAERYSLRSIWDLDSYLLGPFPSSPLQPLPPSPPPTPQEQRPPHPPRSPRPPCKARRRLFCE